VIDEQLQEQASLYALGALDDHETREFEATLKLNPELSSLVRDLRAVTEALAGSVPALEPPASIKARLMMQIDSQRRPPAVSASASASGAGSGSARPAIPWVPWALAAGLAVVTFGSLWQSTALRSTISSQARRIEELGMSLDIEQAESGNLRQTVAKLRESNRVAAVRIALLNSLVAADPKAVAVSVWDNERQNGVFIVKNLKPAPIDKDYQLWIIDPKYPSPVDAGVFKVDDKGNVRQEFKAHSPIQTASQFAVTIEKKGGAEVPDTKAMVLAGA
jgi:anti-sigma-K factor RskA